MKGKCIDKLIGQYCKVVTQEPGEEKSNVVSGIVREIDHDSGFVVIESKQGSGCLNINTIVAIKPRRKH